MDKQVYVHKAGETQKRKHKKDRKMDTSTNKTQHSKLCREG